MGLGLEIKSSLMLALKFPLQDSIQSWNKLHGGTGSLTLLSFALTHYAAESSQHLHGNDTQGKSPDAAWQRGERLGYL